MPQWSCSHLDGIVRTTVVFAFIPSQTRILHRPTYSKATSLWSFQRCGDVIHRGYTSTYKFKLGWSDSPTCLACRCSQFIEPILCCLTAYIHVQFHLRNTLELLTQAEYSVVKVLGPWNTSGHQQTPTRALLKFFAETDLQDVLFLECMSECVCLWYLYLL